MATHRSTGTLLNGQQDVGLCVNMKHGQLWAVQRRCRFQQAKVPYQCTYLTLTLTLTITVTSGCTDMTILPPSYTVPSGMLNPSSIPYHLAPSEEIVTRYWNLDVWISSMLAWQLHCLGDRQATGDCVGITLNFGMLNSALQIQLWCWHCAPYKCSYYYYYFVLPVYWKNKLE